MTSLQALDTETRRLHALARMTQECALLAPSPRAQAAATAARKEWLDMADHVWTLRQIEARRLANLKELGIKGTIR